MENALLIVVHPGSLCGSADMYLRGWAEGTRGSIAAEIARWQGAVAIVTGDLDDELDLPKYSTLKEALAKATFRTYGAPFNDTLRSAAARIAKHFGLTKGAQVVVTGAWNDHDGTGCVTCVADALKRRGFGIDISDNAPASDADPDDGDGDDDE